MSNLLVAEMYLLPMFGETPFEYELIVRLGKWIFTLFFIVFSIRRRISISIFRCGIANGSDFHVMTKITSKYEVMNSARNKHVHVALH